MADPSLVPAAVTAAPGLGRAAGLLAADDTTGVLIRCLLVAAVLVTPYGIHKRRQVRAERARRAAEAAGPTEADAAAGPRLEDVVADIEAVATDLAGAGTGTVLVPAGVTLDGRDAPPELVDALVRDALRRSGLVATAELDTPGGRVIECRRA